ALGSLLSVALSSAPAKREQYITIRRGRTTTKQILYLTWGTLQKEKREMNNKRQGLTKVYHIACRLQAKTAIRMKTLAL
ncbi:MAG: hypothetical protein PHU22_03105, partial [Eubacteriales bacterium]|nr:hypothetical protein [Eubacteriales bacterium]